MNCKDFYETITFRDLKYKNIRLYNLNKCSSLDVLCNELFYYFKDVWIIGQKFISINCIPKHNIYIPNNDLAYLNENINNVEKFENHIFSDNILKIKELQNNDFSKIFNLSINSNKINSFFVIPKLYNNLYCFDFFFTVDKDFELSNLFDINFELFEIKSHIIYNKDNFDINVIYEKFYPNSNFNNHITTDNEKKTNFII